MVWSVMAHGSWCLGEWLSLASIATASMSYRLACVSLLAERKVKILVTNLNENRTGLLVREVKHFCKPLEILKHYKVFQGHQDFVDLCLNIAT